MFHAGRWSSRRLWVGVALGSLLMVSVVFWVLGQQSSTLRRYIVENVGAPTQQLQIYRDFYCWPAGSEKERTKKLSIGFGRKVLHAEAFLSGFNLSGSGRTLAEVERVRADASITSMQGNYVTLELIYALAGSERTSTEACIGWTILAVTTTD